MDGGDERSKRLIDGARVFGAAEVVWYMSECVRVKTKVRSQWVNGSQMQVFSGRANMLLLLLSTVRNL